MTDLPDKPWFWVTEAAKLLGISRRTIYRWIEAGEIDVKGHKYFTRISRESLLKKWGN